jgi:hypothetical protein
MVSGLIAAWYWFKSSKVTIRHSSIDIMTLQPDDPKRLSDGLLNTIWGFQKASDLNSKAALWSAIAVLWGAVSGMLGLWTSN